MSRENPLCYGDPVDYRIIQGTCDADIRWLDRLKGKELGISRARNRAEAIVNFFGDKPIPSNVRAVEVEEPTPFRHHRVNEG